MVNYLLAYETSYQLNDRARWHMELVSDSVELMRIIFLLGAVLALLYKKRFGVTPGGIIVPGTLAVVLSFHVIAFIISLVTGILCWAIYKFTFGHYALPGRWSSLANISISVIMSLAIMSFAEAHRVLDKETVLLSMIAPGLIAISARKYGLQKVVQGTIITSALAAASGIALALLIPHSILLHLNVRLASYEPLALSHPLIVLPVSLLTAVVLYYKFKVRGGGYLIAPFLAAALASSIVQGTMILAGVILSYLIVKLIQKHTLIIGLDRFVLSLFCGYFVITAADILATHFVINGYRPSTLVLIIAVAVMTNDLCLQPVRAALLKGISPALFISLIARLAV